MKSPFPGMDPYLEARWSDVHVTLIARVKEALQPLLPRGLRARSEERVLLENLAEEQLGSYRSDVALIDTGRGSGGATRAAAVAEIEPVFVRLYPAPEIDRFVQIIDTSSGHRVVSAIDIMSPWNKDGGDLHELYLIKLKDYRRAGVNIVELDLLRS